MTVPARRSVPALLQIDSVLKRLNGREALAEVCRFLRAEFRQYGWVGIYRREGDALALVVYDGDRPTEHTRIPIERGLCGRAVRENATVVVGDVRTAPEYLACFLETRSEIVVPIRDVAGVAIGEIDIDGTEVNAYDASDAKFLEDVARKISAPFGAMA